MCTAWIFRRNVGRIPHPYCNRFPLHSIITYCKHNYEIIWFSIIFNDPVFGDAYVVPYLGDSDFVELYPKNILLLEKHESPLLFINYIEIPFEVKI